jgi:uncharacterized membrane protein (DUF2068 family)
MLNRSPWAARRSGSSSPDTEARRPIAAPVESMTSFSPKTGEQSPLSTVAEPRDRFLAAIAVFKFAKALLFIAAALAAHAIIRPTFAADVQDWVSDLPYGTEQRVAQAALSRLIRMGPGRVQALGIVAIAYAGLFLTEGIGLWRQRHWAEWLTVVATASLVPLEIWESARHLTVIKALVLLANLAILGYLIRIIRQNQRAREALRAARLSASP